MVFYRLKCEGHKYFNYGTVEDDNNNFLQEEYNPIPNLALEFNLAQQNESQSQEIRTIVIRFKRMRVIASIFLLTQFFLDLYSAWATYSERPMIEVYVTN